MVRAAAGPRGGPRHDGNCPARRTLWRWLRDRISALAAKWRWPKACFSALARPWRRLRVRRAEAYDRNKFTWLEEFGQVPAGGPKFVFAAAATITGRDKPAPGLNAVSYVLSHDYIGGPELGWMNTSELFCQSPPRIKRDLTVLTAVAVSGAAFASAMGRYQKGFEKLLAISGARLGTWLPNPKFVANVAAAQKDECLDPKDNTRPWPRSLPYVRGAGYYYRELFGLNNSDARLVQVTDGGHYENLGLVEALRRRSRLIFCVDGGGDRPPLASGLGDALRLAKSGLGVTITFDRFTRYPLSDLTPGSGEPFKKDDAFYSLNSRPPIGPSRSGASRTQRPPAWRMDRSGAGYSSSPRRC